MNPVLNSTARFIVLTLVTVISAGQMRAQADANADGAENVTAPAIVNYQILDADGKPVKGAIVRPHWGDCLGISSKYGEQITTDSGDFSLPVCEKPHSISILDRIFDDGFSFTPENAATATIRLSRKPELATHALSVELVDENDQVISGPKIKMYKNGELLLPFALQSLFDWSGIPTGKVFLKVDESREFAASDFTFSVLENTNLKIKIKLCSKFKANCEAGITTKVISATVDTGFIMGAVVDPEGRGIAGIPLRAKGPAGVKTALTNAEGYFEILYLTPARYELSIKSDKKPEDEPYLREFIHIEVKARTVPFLKIKLRRNPLFLGGTSSVSP